MRKLLSCLIVFLVSTSASLVNADLVINITGVHGEGFSTFSFVTTTDGVVSLDGSIRDNTAVLFGVGDTAQFGGGDAILDATIQDQLLVLTGDATVSVTNIDRFGVATTVTEDITGIFLDDVGAGAGDDLGIRVANQIDYLEDDTVNWTGSGTINVDITRFVEGTFQMNSGAVWSIDQGNTIVSIVATVPEPSGAIGFAILGLVGLTVRRKK